MKNYIFRRIVSSPPPDVEMSEKGRRSRRDMSPQRKGMMPFKDPMIDVHRKVCIQFTRWIHLRICSEVKVKDEIIRFRKSLCFWQKKMFHLGDRKKWSKSSTRSIKIGSNVNFSTEHFWIYLPNSTFKCKKTAIFLWSLCLVRFLWRRQSRGWWPCIQKLPYI